MLRILETRSDQADGRLLITYERDGVKVQDFKPADHIAELETDLAFRIEEERICHEAALQKKDFFGGIDAAAFYQCLLAEREVAVMRLDLLREIELGFCREDLNTNKVWLAQLLDAFLPDQKLPVSGE